MFFSWVPLLVEKNQAVTSGMFFFAAVLLGALMTIEPVGYGVLVSASVSDGARGTLCDIGLVPWTNFTRNE